MFQAEMVLMFEQKPEEFRPPAGAPLALDTPTCACLLVTAILAAVQKAAAKYLEGANLASFLQEVGGGSGCGEV